MPVVRTGKQPVRAAWAVGRAGSVVGVVAPVTQSGAANAETLADRVEALAGGDRSTSHGANLVVVHESRFAATTDRNGRFVCPGWDSNPHWMLFESMASAVGLPGLNA